MGNPTARWTGGTLLVGNNSRQEVAVTAAEGEGGAARKTGGRRARAGEGSEATPRREGGRMRGRPPAIRHYLTRIFGNVVGKWTEGARGRRRSTGLLGRAQTCMISGARYSMAAILRSFVCNAPRSRSIE